MRSDSPDHQQAARCSSAGAPASRCWTGLLVVVARVCAVAGALLFATALPGGPASKEYSVKAAFLYNFTKFVEWPAQCFASPDAPIVIGVVGADPFDGELEKIVRDRRVNGRPISVVMLRTAADARDVHVLFVPAGDKRSTTISRHPSGVLTVGETEQFAAEHGMVRFTTVEQKVRFEVNAAAAEEAGLKISAQLLKLAATVRRAGEEQP